MIGRLVRNLLLASAALIGVRSGATLAIAAPSASLSQVAAGTPRQAVVRIIQPFIIGSAQRVSCNAVMGKIAACPLTPRLRAAVARELRWERAHPSGGNGNEFCRCQNPARRVLLTGVTAPYVTASGRYAKVKTAWYWGVKPVNLTWVTRHGTGGWQVDNSFCTGHPRMDLYHIPVGPCPAG